jgi:carbon storage regulator
MLVLTRKRSESILIGRDIRITVVAISGGKIRLGIEAPDSMGIVRFELLPTDSRPTASSHIDASEHISL